MADVTQQGYRTITPYLTVPDASRAIALYKQAFGAAVKVVHPDRDGMVMHAELMIGDSMVMIADVHPHAGFSACDTSSRVVTGLHMYVEDVDEAFDRAVRAGAQVALPLADRYWGDRYGKLVDAFGQNWSMASRKRDAGRK